MSPELLTLSPPERRELVDACGLGDLLVRGISFSFAADGTVILDAKIVLDVETAQNLATLMQRRMADPQ